jgi:uncharacterized repeat protein (TIGR01451 family)
VHYWANSTPGTQRDDARYTVYYDGGTASQRINQQQTADGSPAPGGADSGWLTLGLYPFAKGTGGYVTLDDSTTPGGTGANVVADAVRFLATRVWVDDSYTPAGTNDGHLWGVTAFDNIPAGIQAVADYGTVVVRPGTYTAPLLVTKPITISGANAATTIILVPPATDTAVELLSSDAHISGFTIQSAGATYGIRNYETAPGPPTWVYVTDVSIRDCIIEGFDYGIRLRSSGGLIDGNTIRNNARLGVWGEDPGAAATAPISVSNNTFSGNGGTAGYDSDIRFDDSYAGSEISGNTITGSGAGSESCVYVHNGANDLTLSANAISGCTYGVYVLQDAGAGITQKVNLYGNTITAGTRGVFVHRTGGTFTTREIVIGGSVDNANSIYDNGTSGGQDELWLQGYSADVNATHNYWGVCTYREIEDEIRHDWDFGSLGTVTYDPALCVPYTVTVEANPTSLPADGSSTSTITATAVDVAGNYVENGTMIGITTSLGSVPFGYVEAESSAVTVTNPGVWTQPAHIRYYAGQVMRACNPTGKLEWAFTGEAVSLIYHKRPGAGVANVYIDGVLQTTIDMNSTINEYRVEDVIATFPSVGSHVIAVEPQGPCPAAIYIDAFRSGGLVASAGRVVTQLTAATVPGVANVVATAYNGYIITTSSAQLYPIVTGTVTVTFQAADLYIDKTASPGTINAGQDVVYTINYGNKAGFETATDTMITDTLPANFVYVSSTSSPDLGDPTFPAPDKVVWDVGDLAPGQTGSISLVARPDRFWCTPVGRTNVAEILGSLPDAAAGDNSDSAAVSIIVPDSVTMSAHPPAIRVSNGTITTTLRITVTDGNSNLVHNVPVSVTTTAGSFPATGGSNVVVTTTNGVALAQLASDTTITTATVTATVLPACPAMPTTSIDVPFLPGLPYTITVTIDPTTVRVCGDTATVTATVEDEFGNAVEDGTEVQFQVVAAAKGYMSPEWVPTSGGVAVSTLHTGAYEFGERFLTVRVMARRQTQQVVTEEQVDLLPGLPDSIDLAASPEVISVGGDRSHISSFVSDCAGNPVDNGTVVTFTASALGIITPTVTTTVDGWAYADFKTLYPTHCTVGTAVITAMADSIVATVDVQLEPGPADHFGSVTLSPSGPMSNCGDTAVLESRVYDRCNNPVKDGTQVQFGVAFDMVSVLPNPARTVNGAISATVTTLNKPLLSWPLSHEQIGLASGSALPTFIDIWIEPGDPQFIELTADPESIPIQGVVHGYDIIVEAKVMDCSGSPVTDTTAVRLQTDNGLFRESGTWSVVRYTVGGVVTATLTSEERAGEVTITATADSVITTTTVFFEPGEPYHLDVYAIPFSIYADGRSTTMVTAEVSDFYYNAVGSGITVTFITDHGSWVESGDIYYTTTTRAGGLAFATLRSSTAHIGTVNIYAVTYNGRIGPGIVQFVAPPTVWYLYIPIAPKYRLIP